MKTKSVQLPVYYFGTPIALITTMNVAGNVNITPMSSAWALGDRIVLGLSEMSQGRENLLRERQAVLNFPDASLWQSVEAIARLTGRNPVPEHKKKYGYTYAADKLASLGLTSVASEIVRPYRIQECPLQIEVELLASHDPAFPMPGSPESFQILETSVPSFSCCLISCSLS